MSEHLFIHRHIKTHIHTMTASIRYITFAQFIMHVCGEKRSEVATTTNPIVHTLAHNKNIWQNIDCVREKGSAKLTTVLCVLLIHTNRLALLGTLFTSIQPALPLCWLVCLSVCPFIYVCLPKHSSFISSPLSLSFNWQYLFDKIYHRVGYMYDSHGHISLTK